MDTQFKSEYIPYSHTGKFSKIVLDYVSGAVGLKEFYEHAVSLEGIKSAIANRKKFKTNRQLLVEQFRNQYKDVENSDIVKSNIEALSDENTFTICTAHQPNIFTGHLYFVYKILHIIQLADSLKKELPAYNFVPVFFVGSEDADLEELNHIVIDGEKYTWKTEQKGAVGRMKVDDQLLKLIDKISGRLSVEKYGNELIELLKKCYFKNSTIENSTFLFVHHLFKEYGLLILLPDNASYKNEMLSIFEDDIFNHTSSEIVDNTTEKLSEHYKAQAYPREINLFYLKDNLRNRIVQVNNQFIIHDTNIVFTENEIKRELLEHPKRFSPNVILRGLFQEMLLPDVAWIGGGGELAYWLQLKDVFSHYKVPFPVLVLRNSFLIVDPKAAKLIKKLKLDVQNLFSGEDEVVNSLVKRDSNLVLHLTKEKEQFGKIYSDIISRVASIDTTLQAHVEALKTKHIKKLSALEKKMLRSEKRKFLAQKNQLDRLFSILFPEGGLQERTENFMLFYSLWGKDFFKILYDASLTLEQKFCIIEALPQNQEAK
ncbi:bacillithiol biosynthesis cysteine-adding enzyme BshC [Hanamia caeni]|uniref:Putative cysteine ligase BshC n=1 Tax=Hanamia caeni TaxID=2294116 RepID=A0A3M9N6I8_9BACT|nr:bacillithiol biosynthesis cysteine-adding enzyme BshC [Hanamia caeni]RNI33346.1 bacillithiol biosynthesis cysteine-adding enzyme BshC [Hanamia caeni]